MQKRTFRLIAITVGLLSGASLLLLCHRKKEEVQKERLDDHRRFVKWQTPVQFYGRT